MSDTTKDDITTLAELAYDALRPNPSNDNAYAIERVFRESVKAVKDSNEFRIDPEEAELLVTGRLQKLPDRSDQVYRVPAEDSESGDPLNDRIERYAEAFSHRLLADRCEGKPSLLKRRANNFADGFYAATVKLQQAEYAENDDEPAAAEAPAETGLDEFAERADDSTDNESETSD